MNLAKHLNNVRHVFSKGKLLKINSIVYNTFNKKYVMPKKIEHFDKIENVDFVFDMIIYQLKDPVWKKIFMRWSVINILSLMNDSILFIKIIQCIT